MPDYAQAQINLNNAAIKVKNFFTEAEVDRLPTHLKIAVKNLSEAAVIFENKTKPTRPDTGEDDFDSFHGCG